MKKFIIVIIFVFLIAILISFNYLLWDREKQLESYQDLSDAKNLSIDTLGEKINSLDQSNRELKQRVDTLSEENADLRKNISKLSSENADIKREIFSKDQLISALKINLNTAPFETVIKNWVEAVNSKNYANAQALISKNSQDEILNNKDKFTSTYKSEVKAVRLKSAKLFTEMSDDEHIGKIQFGVILEVDKPDSAEGNKDKIPDELFKTGENEKYFTMDFDQETKEWRISEISEKP